MKTNYSILVKIIVLIILLIQVGCKKEIPQKLDDNNEYIYKTIIIGNQEWMAENLRVTHFQDGSKVPIVLNNNSWSNLTSAAMCWYDNDSLIKGQVYGALYNWYAIIDSRKLCPKGWHIPTDQEWTILADYLGDIHTVGGKMKEAGTQHWYEASPGADNSSGFTALPAGLRNLYGISTALGSNAFFWTSTNKDATTSWVRAIGYGSDKLFVDASPKNNGLSVRCIKD